MNLNNMKFKRKFKSILGTILTVTVLLSSSSAVFAAGPTTATSNTNNAISQQNAKAKALSDMLDPYVTVVNNQLVLKMPKGISGTIDPVALETVKSKIQETNKTIVNSNLTIDKITKTASISVSDQQLLNASSKSTISPMLVGGQTTVVFYWWGFSLYLSSNMVKYIVQGGSAGIAALVSLIPGIGWTIAAAIAGTIVVSVEGDYQWQAKIVDYNWIYGIQGIYNQ